MSDYKFLGLALLLAALPLPGSVVLSLAGLLLASQIAAILLSLLANPPQPYEVRWIASLQDGVTLLAVVLAKAAWVGESPFPWSALQPIWLVPALAANGLYLHWMLHHALAHKKMQQTYQSQVPQRLAEVEADLEVGIWSPDAAQQRVEQILEEQGMVEAICATGQQAGGTALIQMACLAVASAFDLSASLWVGWTLAVSLAGLINSKAQDLLLNHYLPKESRLC